MSGEFPFGHFLKEEPSQNQVNINADQLDILTENVRPSLIPNSQKTNAIASSFTNDELQFINEEILKIINSNITPEKFNAFFSNSFKVSKVNMDSISIQVSTPLIKTMVEKNYLNFINEAFVQILGKQYAINIDVGENIQASSLKQNPTNFFSDLEDEKPKNAKDAFFKLDLEPTNDDLISQVDSAYINHMNPIQNTMSIDKEKTFNNFVIGPSNNMAYAAANAIAKAPGNKGKYPSLYIYSDSGLGKTHLLHAVANGIQENFPHYIIYLISAREFMKEMIDAIQNKVRHEFQKKYSEKVDVLMIDDIHELKNKKGTQDELFHIFNELYQQGKQLIFTSDKSPKEIDGIEERIKSRLSWGLVVDIQKPDLETRIAILKRKAQELDLYLQDDILNLIACSVKSNIRELEGALVRLSAFSDVMKIEIDTEMAKSVLKLNDSEQERKITLDNIVKATAQYYKIHVADLKSKARQKEIANARFVAMYLSRKIARATQQDIGIFYGGRDHSSVVHAEKSIVRRLATEIELSKDIIAIESNL